MLRLLSYIISNGIATVRNPCPPLDEEARGMPTLTESPCNGSGCRACAEVCPTDAIAVDGQEGEGKISLDLGACIGCGLCIDNCPTDTIVENRSSRVAKRRRQDLVLTNDKPQSLSVAENAIPANIFKRSVHARVVSTGCSACDMEIGASSNPVFDLERFGVHVVASPRFADVLMITGPVAKGMQDPLRRCYGAMAEPRAVIAVGTCAISGGVHKDGYTEANGVENILPVDVYIPGCPPHPWSIIHGILVAMGKMTPEPALLPQSDHQSIRK